MKFATKALMFGVATLAAAAVHAAPVVSNLAIPQGIVAFDALIAGTGTAVATAVITGQTTTYTVGGQTVTITRPNGSSIAGSGVGRYSSGVGGMTGDAFGISPGTSSGESIPGYNSGLTFTFSTPVNAFGFEIGDWATCCTNVVRDPAVVSAYGVPAAGSGLWIAFDGGSANLTANALSANDNPGIVAGYGYNNFISAVDSSATFTSVTFFGDGFGEYLVAGGTLRFAAVPIGSVGGVPEPESIALIGLGALALFAARRRAKKA